MNQALLGPTNIIVAIIGSAAPSAKAIADVKAAWNGFAKIILPHIGAGQDEMLVCGMALGYADESALVNTFHTPRVSAAEFTTWVP